MKKITLYLIIIVLLQSCSATWHIKRAEWKDPHIFKSKIDTVIKIEYSDTLIILDTLINVILPKDTVKVDSLVFKTIKPSFGVITKKNGIITTKASMLKGRLFLESFLDSSIIYKLNASILIKDAKITELRLINKNQSVIIEEKESALNNFFLWLKWIGITLVILIILGILYKLYKVFFS